MKSSLLQTSVENSIRVVNPLFDSTMDSSSLQLAIQDQPYSSISEHHAGAGGDNDIIPTVEVQSTELEPLEDVVEPLPTRDVEQDPVINRSNHAIANSSVQNQDINSEEEAEDIDRAIHRSLDPDEGESMRIVKDMISSTSTNVLQVASEVLNSSRIDDEEPTSALERIHIGTSTYVIGLICALPIEYAAIKATLDETYETVTGPDPTEDCSYLLGRMGDHPVVVMCLPSSGYGKSRIITAASNMVQLFPALLFGISIGIGGGAPLTVDIRLGDLVVGKPDDATGTTIVRVGEDGEATLTKPAALPQILLTTINALEAEQELEGTTIPETIENMFSVYPPMKARYDHPGREHDILFNSAYEHPYDRGCEECDMGKVVPRELRKSNSPVIHYGRIVSRNRHCGRARLRDELAYNHDILCIENEGAEISSIFPCLVVRGISNYADSHSNHTWQRWAAAVAAAYVKELLLAMPLFQHEER